MFMIQQNMIILITYFSLTDWFVYKLSESKVMSLDCHFCPTISQKSEMIKCAIKKDRAQ